MAQTRKRLPMEFFQQSRPMELASRLTPSKKLADTSYVRHMAVVDVATDKVNVFKDLPSNNSYYPSWTTDGKQILFTTRPHEVWDLVIVIADGTNFHVLK